MSFSFRRTTITHAHTKTRCLAAYVFVTFRFGSVLDSLLFSALPHFHAHSPPFHLRFFALFSTPFRHSRLTHSLLSLSLSYFHIPFCRSTVQIHMHMGTHTRTHTRFNAVQRIQYIHSHIAAVTLPLCTYDFPSAVRLVSYFIVVQSICLLFHTEHSILTIRFQFSVNRCWVNTVFSDSFIFVLFSLNVRFTGFPRCTVLRVVKHCFIIDASAPFNWIFVSLLF